MKIVFFGASRFIIPVIELLNKKFELALVITTEKNENDAVPAYCRLHKIPYLSVYRFDEEIKNKIKNVRAPIAALGYFGIILPEDVLHIFPKGILNIHPSLLPHYRGATPVQSAILNGDKITGVTIISLDQKMDHGPVLAQQKISINDKDTTEILHDKLFKLGADLLARTTPQYLNKEIKAIPQDHKKATFTKLSFTKKDGYIDLANPPAVEQLDRMIRAYYPWPGIWSKIKINNLEKIIKFLPEKRIQIEGKKPVSYKDFLNGYPQLKEKLIKILPD